MPILHIKVNFHKLLSLSAVLLWSCATDAHHMAIREDLQLVDHQARGNFRNNLIGWHDPVEFVENTSLKPYLENELGPLERYRLFPSQIFPNCTTLYRILEQLKTLITNKQLYDLNNPSIILTDQPLEAALKMQALHLTQVKPQVIQQLKKVDGVYLPPLVVDPPQQQEEEELNGLHLQMGQMGVNMPIQPLEIYPERQFRVKPDFFAVIQQAIGEERAFNANQIFTYDEIARYLSKYIIDNRERFFDQRNIKVVMCEEDLLGAAFGVKAFHRTQVTALMREQLIPV